MINTHDNVWIPSEGYKYITNGVAFSTEIRLGFKDSISNWHDTNEEPPTPPEPEEEATEEDYKSALNELGVETDEEV